MATDVERLIISLEANVKKYENTLAKAQGLTKQKLNGMEREFERFKQRAEGALGSITAGRMLSSISQVGAALGVAFGGREIIAFADAWTNLENRLRSSGVEDTAKGLETVKRIAAASRTDIEAVGELFARLAAASDSTGMSLEETANATQALAQALQVDGASTAEAASTLRQFSQALTSGVLRGEEFNAIAENSNSIMMALMKATGASRAELRALASDGQITGPVLRDALKILEADVGSKFAASTKTVSQALTQMRNEFIAMVGDANKATGATNNLVKIIDFLTKNLGALTVAAAAVGAAIATAFAANGIAAVAGLVARAGALVAALNPVTATVVAIAVAFASLVQMAGGFDEVLQSISGQTAGWADVAQVVRDDLYSAFSEARDIIVDAFNKTTEGFSAIGLSAQNFAALLQTVGNVVMSVVGLTVRNALTTLVAIPQGIAATVRSVINSMVKTVVGAMNLVLKSVRAVIAGINATIDGINTLTGGNTQKIKAPDLIDAESFTIKGQELQDWALELGTKMGQNFEKSFVPYMDSVVDRAASRAEGQRVRLGDSMASMPSAPAKAKLASFAPSALRGGGGGGGSQSLIQRYQQETQEIKAQAQAMQMLTTSGFAAEAQLQMLTEAMKNGATVTEAQKKQIEQVAIAYGEVADAANAAQLQQQQMAQLQQTLAQGFEDAFMSIIEGSGNAADAFKNMAKQILAQIVRMQVQSMVSGFFGGGVTGGATGGGFLSSLFGGLFGRATGGRVNSGQPYVVGESGREVFVPDRSGRILPSRAVKGGGSGGANVKVMNFAGAQVETKTKRGRGGQQEVEILVTEIGKRIAEGNFDKQFRSRFGVGPRVVER